MYRTILVGLSLLLLGGACLQAQDQPAEIHNGFLTGNEYRDLANTQRQHYIMGVIDGSLLAPLFGAPKPKLAWLETCVTGMRSDQVVAIVDKFLEANPVRWHQSMHVLVYSALRESCKDSHR